MPNITVPTIGQTNWGSPLNTALSSLQSQIHGVAGWQPTDQGLISWTFDPATASGSSSSTAQTLSLARFAVRRTSTLTNALYGITTPMVGGVAGQNFLGVYNSAGTLVAQTADQTANFTAATGPRTAAFTAPYVAAEGYYWMALLVSTAGTPPTFIRGGTGTGGWANLGTTAATTRFGSIGAGLTALPASITPGSITSSAMCWLFGVS